MSATASRAKQSAGLLMYCLKQGRPLIFLVHPGGPFWAHKDRGCWSIPKGEIEPDEDPLAAALREFEEETGIKPQGPFHPLGSITQKGGKTVHAWAFEGDSRKTPSIKSNMVTLEWPARSGRFHTFPEVDKGAFFDLEQARLKLHPAQIALIERLESLLNSV